MEGSCLNCFISFLLSALNTAKRDQNIVLGYTLEETCAHNHCFREEMKNKLYPIESKFKYIKVDIKGVLRRVIIIQYYFNMTIEASWRQCQRCNLCAQPPISASSYTECGHLI